MFSCHGEFNEADMVTRSHDGRADEMSKYAPNARAGEVVFVLIEVNPPMSQVFSVPEVS